VPGLLATLSPMRALTGYLNFDSMRIYLTQVEIIITDALLH
jgi:hypothetical protein